MAQATEKKFPILLAKNILTEEDFIKHFKQVIDLVLKIQNQQKEAIAELEKTYKLFLTKNKENYDSSFAELKGYLEKQDNKMYQEHEKMMAKIDDKLAEIKDGKTPIAGIDFPLPLDGKNPDPKEIVPLVLAQLPNEELKLEDIKGLKEELEKLEKRISSAARGTIGGMKKIVYSKTMDLSSQVDGSKKTFLLDERVLKVNYVQSSQFPFIYRKDVDFTATDLRVTLTSAVTAIQPTQTLFVHVDLAFFSK